MYHVHARKRLWEDWDFFLERSPIYYVEKCRTPLLILHGRDDTRVNPGQSLELYRNLKILGQHRSAWSSSRGKATATATQQPAMITTCE
ncbi:MAG: alpha/beta hydrolase family protein [Planctomycetota bacterium]